MLLRQLAPLQLLRQLELLQRVLRRQLQQQVLELLRQRAQRHCGLARLEPTQPFSKRVRVPLLLLAIPSVVIGFITIQPMLFGDFLKDAIHVDLARHPAMKVLANDFHGATRMAVHAFYTLPFWLALASAPASRQPVQLGPRRAMTRMGTGLPSARR